MKTLDKNKRFREMVEMRCGGATHESIGKEFGVTRERVRQILKKNGFDDSWYKHNQKKVEVIVCLYCRKEFECVTSNMAKNKYCSNRCATINSNYWCRKFGKLRDEWTEDEFKEVNRYNNYKKLNIEARDRYYRNNKKKIRKRHNEYLKRRYKEDEVFRELVHARQRAYRYKRYHNDEEYRRYTLDRQCKYREHKKE